MRGSPGAPTIAPVLELQGPFAVIATVLVVSGVQKLRDPQPTATMLRALHLPGWTAAVYALAATEVLVGVAAFVQGGWLAALAVAALYGAFTVVSVLLLRRGAISCGCFGSASTRMSSLHVGVNVVATVLALAAAVLDVPGFVDARAELPWAGVPQFAYTVVGAALVVAVLTVLPDTLEAARRGPRRADVPEFSIRGEA